jgi:ribosomal protein L2
MVGNSISLANIPIGTWVYNIEWNIGQGTMLIRVVRTFVQIINFFENRPQCIVQLPSGVDKLRKSRCQATINIMFNHRHGEHKLHKVGPRCWLNKCPIIRGVTMNIVDCLQIHTKGGRPSISPWGKASKGGFKT